MQGHFRHTEAAKPHCSGLGCSCTPSRWPPHLNKAVGGAFQVRQVQVPSQAMRNLGGRGRAPIHARLGNKTYRRRPLLLWWRPGPISIMIVMEASGWCHGIRGGLARCPRGFQTTHRDVPSGARGRGATQPTGQLVMRPGPPGGGAPLPRNKAVRSALAPPRSQRSKIPLGLPVRSWGTCGLCRPWPAA